MLSRLAVVLALLVPTACTDRPQDGSASGSTSDATTADPTNSTAGHSTSTSPTTGPSTSGQPGTTSSSGATSDATTSSGVTTDGATSSGVTSSGATSDSTTSDTSTSDTSSTTSEPPEDACDIWKQDCPEGQKCQPVGPDSQHPNEFAACRPLVDDPDALGEPCTVLGKSFEGLDTCPEGQFCWRLNIASPAGTCLALCAGSPDDPLCPEPGLECALHPKGVENLCVRACDPLVQDCPAGDVCVEDVIDDVGWMCLDDASGDEGQLFGHCSALNDCDPGLYCGSSIMINCDGGQSETCCLPWCDLTADPDTCPVGLQCLQSVINAPPGLGHVGVCGKMPQ